MRRSLRSQEVRRPAAGNHRTCDHRQDQQSADVTDSGPPERHSIELPIPGPSEARLAIRNPSRSRRMRDDDQIEDEKIRNAKASKSHERDLAGGSLRQHHRSIEHGDGKNEMLPIAEGSAETRC